MEVETKERTDRPLGRKEHDMTLYNGAWIYPVVGGWEANLYGCHYDAEDLEALKQKIDKALRRNAD